MSTVEIAELTGKRHFNVLRDARKMLAELAQSHASDLMSEISAVESTYISERGPGSASSPA